LENFYQIPKSVFAELFSLEDDKLQRNLTAFGSVLLVYALDEPIYDFWMDNIQSDRLNQYTSGILYDIGTPKGALIIHAGTAISAGLMRDDYLWYTTLLSAQSVILSQAFTSVVKELAGRERPRDANGHSNLWLEGGQSFFSGHASGAFAAWTVFAERYRHNTPLYGLFYGLAAATAVARLNEDAHWPSDILAGSLAGYGIAQLTLKHQPFQTNQAWIIPQISDQHIGLNLYLSF
jgi:membrane-associated phospholipid phosphatase